MLRFVPALSFLFCFVATPAKVQTTDSSFLSAHVTAFDNACLTGFNQKDRASSQSFSHFFPSSEASRLDMGGGLKTDFLEWQNSSDKTAAAFVIYPATWSCSYEFRGDDTAYLWNLVNQLLFNRYSDKFDIVVYQGQGPVFLISGLEPPVFIQISDFSSLTGWDRAGNFSMLSISAFGNKE